MSTALPLAEQLADLAERASDCVRKRIKPSSHRPGRRRSELAEIARRTFTLPDGTTAPYLTEEELHFLQITHGTLDDRERAEVESHVSQTYEYLVRIPWTDDLKNLAPYAYGHHEKLRASAIRAGCTASEIPIQTRMITIADMFDALTDGGSSVQAARVRSRGRIDILQSEAKAGRLDRELVPSWPTARPTSASSTRTGTSCDPTVRRRAREFLATHVRCYFAE